MTQEKKPASHEAAEADRPGEPERPEGGGAAEAGPEAADERIGELEAENAKLKDQLLRALAEMENLRRRTEKEIKDTRQYAISGFARDVLSVSDNLHRAIEAVGEDARDGADAVLEALISGVEMTEREMLKYLDKHGVKRIDPDGERFDPNFHQAMFEVPNPDVPAGTVVQVMQAGYVIGERMLRPAMVGVAKGGAKPEKPAAAESNWAKTPDEAADPDEPAADGEEAGSAVDREV